MAESKQLVNQNKVGKQNRLKTAIHRAASRIKGAFDFQSRSPIASGADKRVPTVNITPVKFNSKPYKLFLFFGAGKRMKS